MKTIGIIAVIILLLCLVIAGPFLTIASLNTLLGLNIGYTIYTWLSVAWLSFTTFGSVVMAINKLNK